ncbi:DUF3501 family protein [Pandoraea sp.]|uniref:DUF3501 family protein n=1 Tax=Pandoraea sp. TaxID=1883445 RepID=UPI0011FBF53C|nr:DUF3501 family protein [Pandoraea sp.]TAL53626.1 MAG: DUF3501 family protein [Pandoraea sp.]TAM14831.1 MAG: DUF3501 family protein [Pandoraea sp.]
MSISRESLWPLEEYARRRQEFRAEVMAHKKRRTVAVGDHVTLIFEDELTVRYQIQEMLRIERTFEERGILDELDAYNPLIPDGHNLKATMMIEYADEAVRKVELTRLLGVQDRVYVQVGQHPRVFAIADEDLDRQNETKTSSVHFLRFELTPEMIAGLRGDHGQRAPSLAIGIEHPNYTYRVDAVAPETLAALARDLA